MPHTTRTEPYPASPATGGTPAPSLLDARTTELIDRAVQIEQRDARAAGTIGFMSRIFCQCALPYREPALDKHGEVPRDWVRQNGGLTLRLRPGLIDADKPTERYAYPYGVMPRYLLAWMASEIKHGGPAVQDDGLTLDLGGSTRAFLRQIGIGGSQGGPRGSATRLRDQVTRLAYANVIVTDTREHGDGVWNHRGENFGFVTKTDLWWSDRDRDTDTLWPNTIRLSEAWRDSIKASAVPLDTRALALIQKAKAGPLALDLYYWLAHRMFTVRKTTTVPWALLARQFGSQYTRPIDFRRAVMKALRVVKLAYPTANVAGTERGLMLRPSPPPVARQTVIDARVTE